MADQKQPERKTLSVTPDVKAPDPVKPEVDPAFSQQGRTVSPEEFDELRAQNEDLINQNALLSQQFQELMKEIRTKRAADAHVANPMPTSAEPIEGQEPIFLEDEPHGVVTGDSEVGFVQNGHQFSRDKRYLATEKYRGVPRAFNPRLVGVVRPKPAPNLM
jgi:hypothetical protein